MILEILYFAVIIVACIGIGKRISSAIGINPLPFLEDFIVSVSLGLGVLSAVVFVLGIFGLLYNLVLWIVIVFLLVFTAKDIKSVLAGLHIYENKVKSLYGNLSFKFKSFMLASPRNTLRYRRPQKFIHEKLLWLTIIFMVLSFVNFVAVFAPVSEMDSLAYHLAVPKLYAKHHSIYYIPDIAYSNFPFFTEMLFTAGIVMKGSSLALMFSFFFGILGALCVYLFVKRFLSRIPVDTNGQRLMTSESPLKDRSARIFSKNTAWVSSFVFYSLPIVSERVSQGMVEITLTAYTIVSFFCLMRFFETHKSGWLLICALFSGIVASIKITGILHVFYIGIILFYWLIFEKKAGITKAIRKSVMFVFVSFIVALPWYVKSYVYTGNPVYPLMYNVFGGKYWDRYLAEFFSNALNSYGLGKGIIEYILLPLNLTIYGSAFDLFVGIVPVFLTFVPLIFFMRLYIKNFRYILAYCFMFVTSWFFTSQQARFLLPVFCLLSIVAGYVAVILSEKKALRYVITASLVFMFLFNIAISFGINGKVFPVVFGFESKEEYLDNLKDFNPYNVSMFINSLDKSSKTLLIGMHRVYYIENDFVQASPQAQGYVAFSKIGNENEFSVRIKELGITHIAVERNFIGKIIDEKIPYLENFLESNARLLYKHKETEVYELI